MEKEKYLVSIIVPVYKVERYIERCIESILAQTYKNIELILINDGSDDNSLQICNVFSNRDKRKRDIDKEKEANIKFIDSRSVKTPVVEGCDRYFECKIVYKQEIDLENMDKDIVKAVYSKDAKHVLYFGEIVEEY